MFYRICANDKDEKLSNGETEMRIEGTIQKAVGAAKREARQLVFGTVLYRAYESGLLDDQIAAYAGGDDK